MSGLSNLEMCSTTVPSEVINSKDLAAFQSKYIWSLNQTLNVAFLNDGSNTRYKTAQEFPGAKVDPLQYEFDRQYKNKTFDMKKAVKRIVEERINPLIKGHLNFNFIEDKNLAVIRIQFNEMGGCSSQIGSQAKKIEDTQYSNHAVFLVRCWYGFTRIRTCSRTHSRTPKSPRQRYSVE